MNILKLSWKNLTHKPLNMFMSLILFGLGVALISFLILLNKQLEAQKDNNLAGIDMVIGAKGSPLQMILCSMYHVDNPTGNIKIGDAKAFMRPGHPLVEMAVPISVGDNYRNYRIVGTSKDIITLYEGTMETGRLWEKPYEATIGASVAADLGLKEGDRFESSHGLVTGDEFGHEGAEPFVVVGILAPSNSVLDQLILCSTPTIWMVHSDHGTEMPGDTTSTHEGHDHDSDKPLYEHVDEEITSLLIRFKARNFQTLNLPRNINENTPLMAASPPILINKFFSQLGIGLDVIKYLAAAIVLVSGISLFIFLFAALRERKYELALMRVMGSSQVSLFILILLEAILLAVLGFLLGIGISHLGMELLGTFLKDNFRYNFTGWQFYIEEAWIFAGAIALALVAAIPLAFQASQTDISQTLSE